MRLILASASPRRADLLSRAGLEFDVCPTDVDESPVAGEPPDSYVVRVARDKARGAAQRRGTVRPVLGADTAVVVSGRVLGKPAHDDEARSMLRLLSGRVHEVLTGVALLSGRDEVKECVTTRVRFVSLTDQEIEWYVGTGEPRGKAGAYAIQGGASRFVDWIEGSWANVVGLPVATVYRMLRQAGVIC